MTLALHTFRKLTNRHALLMDIALIVVSSLLVAASAQVRFYLPNTPVPVTLQTLAVLLIGATLGSWRGMAAVATYVAAGTLGLPFFAGLNGGALALVGPTGGYLLGFVLAAAMVGWLADRKMDRKWTSALPMFLVGQLIIYLCGLVWLSLFVGGIAPAFVTGVLPFLLGDGIKVTVAILALPTAWRMIQTH